MASEAPYVAALIKALNTIDGVFVWRQRAGCLPVRGGFMHLAPKGACDIVGIGRTMLAQHTGMRTIGIFLSYEVKATKTGKAKDNGQDTLRKHAEWAAMIHAAGGIHIPAAKRDDESMADAVARVVDETRRRLW